jgi:hypothetical protein|nr:MAG TPA: hypothetical protein [Caudoviricetes sp.]
MTIITANTLYILTYTTNKQNVVNSYISVHNKLMQTTEMNNNKQINKQHHNEKIKNEKNKNFWEK